MAAAETTEVFNCKQEQFYKIITDYEKYPEFLKEVTECRVLETKGNKKLVEFNVSLIKTFKYSLWMTETPNLGLNWELASGEMFKTSVGHWQLSEEAGKTRANYKVDATFNMFVPGPIAKALVSVNLPTMISAYSKRVQELYGK